MVWILDVVAITTALVATLSRATECGIVEVAGRIAHGAVLLRMSLACAAFFTYDPDHPLRRTASASDCCPRRCAGSWRVVTPERRL